MIYSLIRLLAFVTVMATSLMTGNVLTLAESNEQNSDIKAVYVESSRPLPYGKDWYFLSLMVYKGKEGYDSLT